MHFFKLLATLTFLSSHPVRADASGWSAEILWEDWTLSGFGETLDLSGIAASGERHCVIGSDELHHLQTGTIDRSRRSIVAGNSVPLPTKGKGKSPEIDIEGIAVSRGESVYYVTGSHGVGKKKGDVQPDRHGVFMVPYDPESGQILADGIRRSSLLPWIEDHSELGPFVGHPLQRNGLNFEGLAHAEGSLWFGARGPSIGGTGFVIEVSPDALFGQSTATPKIHSLPVGEGRGIREITAISNGFLILTGNASAEASKIFPASLARDEDTDFRIHFWDPRQPLELVPIIRLPENGGKAEAMLVLGETARHIDVLVIHDGLPDGSPTSLRLAKPQPK